MMKIVKENCSEWLQKASGIELLSGTKDLGEQINPYAKIIGITRAVAQQ